MAGETEVIIENHLSEEEKGCMEVSSPIMEISGINVNQHEPALGMLFESELAARRSYNMYALRMGFGMRIKLCRRSKINNELIAGWYVCSCEGKSVTNEKVGYPRNATRTGCCAAMKVKRIAVREWKVIYFKKEHNHELDPKNAFSFRSHKVQKTSMMHKSGIRPKNMTLMFGERSGDQKNAKEKEADCSISIAKRFHDICLWSLKIAEEASLSKESYDVALCALQEALTKIVDFNNTIGKDGQSSRGNTHLETCDGSQGTAVTIVHDPKMSKMVDAPNKRVKSGIEKEASNHKKRKSGGCRQVGYNGTSCTKVQEFILGSNTSSGTLIRDDVGARTQGNCLDISK